MIKRFLNEKRGGLVEYLIILCIAGVVAATTFPGLRTNMSSWFTGMTNDITQGISGTTIGSSSDTTSTSDSSTSSSTDTSGTGSTGSTGSSGSSGSTPTIYYYTQNSVTNDFIKYDANGNVLGTIAHSTMAPLVVEGRDSNKNIYFRNGYSFYETTDSNFSATAVPGNPGYIDEYFGQETNGNIIVSNDELQSYSTAIYTLSPSGSAVGVWSCHGIGDFPCITYNVSSDKYGNVAYYADDDYDGNTLIGVNGTDVYDDYSEAGISYVLTNNGDLYIVTNSGTLKHVAFTGYKVSTSSTLTITGMNASFGLFTNSSGILYGETNGGSTTNYYKIDLVNKTVGSPIATLPNGGTLNPDSTGGFYYINGTTVKRFDSNLQLLWSYTTSSNVAGEDVYTDSSNNTFLCLSFGNQIQTINYSSGQLTNTVTLPNSARGPLYVSYNN